MTKTPTPPSSLADESVTFIQHALPGLDDGSYKLDIHQHVDDAKGNPISGDTLQRTYGFAITGDRFRFQNPTATVASTFPADTATGEYDTVFAHAVFASTSLPWMRSPTSSTPPSLPDPGKDGEADVPTWLAVLVLDDDDVAAAKALGSKLDLDPVTRTVGDLFPVAAVSTSSLDGAHSYFDGATDTTALEIDETIADPVQTIDLPLALWADLAPTLDDLKLTAHVRRVAVENKPVTLGDAPQVDPLGAFSIVVATRLPQPSKRSRAYLVSLEGLVGLLSATDAGGTLTDPNVDLGGTLRLAVLATWSFNSTGSSATFVDQLERLNHRTPKGPDAANTTLRLTKAGASPPVNGALAAGYVPLNHELRTGETTVSWYRGPLGTIDATPTPIALPISSPDAALVFDPTTGLFDASLAAAWTIGRLAALQDKSFAASLYAWKKGLEKAAVDAAERQVIQDAFAGLLDADAETAADTAAKAVGSPLLHDAFRLLRTASAAARAAGGEAGDGDEG